MFLWLLLYILYSIGGSQGALPARCLSVQDCASQCGAFGLMFDISQCSWDGFWCPVEDSKPQPLELDEDYGACADEADCRKLIASHGLDFDTYFNNKCQFVFDCSCPATEEQIGMGDYR